MANTPDEPENADDAESKRSKRGKGLWQLMGSQVSPDEADPETDSSNAHSASEVDSVTPQAKPAGLWSVMGQPADPTEAEPTEEQHQVEAEADSNSTSDESASEPSDMASKAAALWSQMKVRHTRTKAETEAKTSEPQESDSRLKAIQNLANPFGTATGSVAQWDSAMHSNASDQPADTSALESDDEQLDVLDKEIPFDPAWVQDSADQFRRVLSTPAPKIRGLTALALGTAAVPLALLDLWPKVWTRAPATVAGLSAIILGLMTVLQLRRLQQTGMQFVYASVAVLLGVTGLFLGPMILAPLGKQWHESSHRQHTAGNLEQIGVALNAYHEQFNQFPAGGVILVDENGDDVAMHSWMTALLPHLGQTPLAESIEYSLPFDDPANKSAMSTIVPQYLSSDNPQRKTNTGMGMSHFAGVGGDIIEEESGLAQAGIFGRNSAVTLNQITDGKSTTLIIGEISYGFPAWGQPDNWRTIGGGLNRDSNGFGNAAGTGALFLRADGSVKFYSNETSLRILEQMSTRDGNEYIDEEIDGGF